MKTIIINGFFGKGNCGDEAILQSWYDNLSPFFHIIASLDMDIVNCNRPNSDLYKNIDLIHNRNTDIFNENIAAYIIGGGGLGLGFGIEQFLWARLRNIKSFYLGTDAFGPFYNGDEQLQNINKNFFQSFKLISFRNKNSCEKLKTHFGIDSLPNPDIAFNLLTEEIEIRTEKKFITITVRDHGINDKDLIKTWIEKIKSFAESENYDILYLPFDKSDEILMKALDLDIKYENLFWTPKKMKYLISKSEMVFSLGRFHPLVFALSSGITCYYIKVVKKQPEFININKKSFCILNDFGLCENYLLENTSVVFKKSEGLDILAKQSIKKLDDFFKSLVITISE